MSLPPDLARRLALPLIAAPMLKVSGPELVIAACREGVVGAFPTANAGGLAGLDAWLGTIGAAVDDTHAPCCPNLIIHRPPQVLAEEIALLRRHRIELVITSVGSPAAVVGPLHDAGCRVFADVGTVAHARKAVALLSAGAGGQTGWLNGLAFVRAVRGFHDGPLVLAGGISDGAALWAAQAAGADLAYMGTRFIATEESLAPPAYRQLLVDCSMDDVQLTRAFTGLPTNMLRPTIAAAGLDPDALDEAVTPARARELFGAAQATFESGGTVASGPKRWSDIRSAGHSVSGVEAVLPVARLVEATRREYREAMRRSLAQIEAAR
ncbi:nitronate monooxygenase [Piscinibacter sakaiensis]|uniref:NAD(P)H-dependent flavin oxidoreductase n=1 Tax=Piscinibacter sakaiensis TaxID=1547922 RepID=UPI003729373A